MNLTKLILSYCLAFNEPNTVGNFICIGTQVECAMKNPIVECMGLFELPEDYKECKK